MIELIAQNMAPIMFASLVVFLIIGYPAAFALAANGLLFFFVGVELAPFSGGSISLSKSTSTTAPRTDTTVPINGAGFIYCSIEPVIYDASIRAPSVELLTRIKARD